MRMFGTLQPCKYTSPYLYALQSINIYILNIILDIESSSHPLFCVLVRMGVGFLGWGSHAIFRALDFQSCCSKIHFSYQVVSDDESPLLFSPYPLTQFIHIAIILQHYLTQLSLNQLSIAKWIYS